MDMQRLQELGYGAERDYRIGSPHLKHWRLYDRLASVLRSVIADTADRGRPLTVLEVGAGHGGYTEVALAAGASVTATEMSRPSLVRLEHRYRNNPGLKTVFDADGSLEVLGNERFSVVMCSSVLHHIPDYLSFLRGPMLKHLDSGGTFLSFQDPLWYPSVGLVTRRLDRWAHLGWRMGQGNLRQGAATFVRRHRGIYDEDNLNDMVEYHAVRQGCDHEAILRLLDPHFETIELLTYWSTASSSLQRLGELMDHPNTFMVHGRRRS